MFNEWQTASAMQLIEVKNELGSAMISLMGAHVMSYQKANSEDILWMSDKSYMTYGKPIRGGIPVCWPWFGPHPDAARKLPSHGLARISVWDIKEKSECTDGSSKLVLSLPGSRLPDEFAALDAEMEIIVGSSLKMSLKTTNNGEKDFNLTQALHTYFNVSDCTKLRVEGLKNTAYIDKVDGGKEKMQNDDVRIGEEVDRIYMDTTATCTLVDEVTECKVEISKSGSTSTVVWNPWVKKSIAMPDFGDEEYHTMICVETVNAGKDVVVLKKGESHTLAMELVEK
ncbi:MAG: D-hexose-6-phosphate mutarotase [Lentisphaeria bacterium]|nr:D-hexose-6-phosphate mutarotase [Lentisphaeria bacterium]